MGHSVSDSDRGRRWARYVWLHGETTIAARVVAVSVGRRSSGGGPPGDDQTSPSYPPGNTFFY